MKCETFPIVLNRHALIRYNVMCRFLDPIILGKYPEEMQEILGSILPIFSKTDLEKMKRGLDFIGINHYTSLYVKDCIFSACEKGKGVSRTEGYALWTDTKDGVLIGEPVCIICYLYYLI